VLPSSGDSFPHLIQKGRPQLGFVTYLLTYLRICAYITFYWWLFIRYSVYNKPKFVCTALNTQNTTVTVPTRTHKTQLFQPIFFLIGISQHLMTTAEVRRVFVSRQQYCLQALDAKSVFLVGVQCQRCNRTCNTRVSCDALLSISSRPEVTSLNRDLELTRWRLLAFPDPRATGTPVLCSV
jgi:hypothetical protein